MLKQLLHLRTLLIALFVMAGSKALSQSFVKVTDVKDLVVGETYILVNTAGTKALGAISTTSTKYGTIVDVSQTESTIVTNSDKIAKLTLGGNSTDGYTFKSSINSQYLTWSSGNSLSTSNEGSSNNQKWTISIASGSTTISNKATTARKIRFNSDRFACYTSSAGTLVNLYKLDASKKETTTTIDASGITNTDVNTGISAGFFSATVKDDSNNTIDASVTWSSSKTSVATINSNGEVTLVAPGTTKITASYAGNDDYAPSSAEYELTVTSSAPVTEETFTFANLGYENAQSVTTVNGSACTLLFNDGTNTQNDPRYYTTGSGVRMYKDNTLTISSTTKTIGSIEFTFDGNNTTLSLDSNQPGELSDVSNSKRTWTGNANSVQFTTTATNRIQAITITYVTTVMGETTLQLSTSSVDPTYGTDATVTATVSNGYDGTLTAKSSNDLIATASVKGTTITITPVAVGKATITVTAPETSTFSGEATETINVTVAAPEGETKAAAITVFEETFADCDGTGGNDGSWNGTIAQNDLHPDNKDKWTFENGNGAKGCAKFGSSSKKGSATTPALRESGELTLSFRAGAWDYKSENTTLNLSVSAGTIDESSVTLTKGEFKTYTAKISNATTETTIKFEAANASNNRFFLDDVVVTKQGVALTAKLNASGYATYCSEYPLDFSNADDYSAWQVKGVDGNAITFEKVTGSVKGGTGLLLMGVPSAMVTLASVDSENELGDNLLKGTLAPTYVEANKYYGLSGKQFLKVNPGTVPAGKALLPANVVGDVNNVRTLSLVFVDPTTGIAETKTMTNEDTIYNLAGQRISKTQRGVNIVGGKKVLVK